MLGIAPVGGITLGGSPPGEVPQSMDGKMTIQLKGKFGQMTSALAIHAKSTIQTKGKLGQNSGSAALFGKATAMIKGKANPKVSMPLHGKLTLQVHGKGIQKLTMFMRAKATIQVKITPKIIELGEPIVAFTQYFWRRFR